MSELEKKAESLANAFMDGKIDVVMDALSDPSISPLNIAFLAADISERLDKTARLIFKRALFTKTGGNDLD